MLGRGDGERCIWCARAVVCDRVEVALLERIGDERIEVARPIVDRRELVVEMNHAQVVHDPAAATARSTSKEASAAR